jgi:hypothetical protein
MSDKIIMGIKKKVKAIIEKLKITLASNKVNLDYAFKLIKIIFVRSILVIIIGFLISFYV